MQRQRRDKWQPRIVIRNQGRERIRPDQRPGVIGISGIELWRKVHRRLISELFFGGQVQTGTKALQQNARSVYRAAAFTIAAKRYPNKSN